MEAAEGLSMRAFSGVAHREMTIRIEIVLRLEGSQGTPGVMLHPSPRGDCTDAPPPIRMTPKPATPLDEAVELWLQHLRARRKREATISVYRQEMRRAQSVMGWRTSQELDAAALVGYLDQQAAEANWKAGTYNRNLTVFRSFTSFMARTGRIASDPLATAMRASADEEHGSRAATTAEARAMLRAAWLRQSTDRRCGANRALYFACLFLAGARFSEPGLWRRRHLALEAEVPHITWSADMQKSRNGVDLALSPELARLLRLHLRADDDARLSRGGEPAGPDDPVFARRPSSPVWRADMKRGGVEHLSPRGERFSPHSARKWFSTTLGEIGANSKMIDRLMRHSSGVDQRYFRPPLRAQVEVLQLLPRLWPEAVVDDAGGVAHMLPTRAPGGLTAAGGGAQDKRATLGSRATHDSANPPPPAGPPLPTSLSRGTTGRGLPESFGGGPCEGQAAGQFDPRVMSQGMAILGSITADRSDLADFFEALARLLRRGSPDAGRVDPERG